MTTTSVGSGVTSTGDTVTSGNTLEVLSGGSIVSTMVSNGGTDQVDFGGSGTSSFVYSGGNEVVLGQVTSTMVSGGSQTISAGGVADHATVTKGAGNSSAASGTQTILAGGSATYTTVSGSATQIVMSGGSAYATTVALGGSEVVSNGGIAISTTLATFASQTIFSGGVATSTTLSGPTAQLVSNGGSATFTSVMSGGFAEVLSGGVLASATVSSGGFEVVSTGGSATFTQVSAGGSAVVQPGGVLASATVTSGGTEVISGGIANATVFGFSGRLDLANLAFSSGESAAVDPNDLLTVTSGGLTVYTQQLTGDYTGDTYSVMSDGAAGTEVTFICFATGTRIRTVRGEVAVEALAIGDMAITASGTRRPITWIGHRTVDCAAAPVPSEAWPVRVRAGAFGANRPARDLYLSPGHPVLVGSGSNERLVPIMCLINGLSVERVETPSITYWHIELDEHDILLAEGLPAESYIDLGSRAWFAGADGALYDPDMAAPGVPGRCRPVAIDGPLVEAERRRLDAVFAMRLAAASQWPARESFAFLG